MLFIFLFCRKLPDTNNFIFPVRLELRHRGSNARLRVIKSVTVANNPAMFEIVKKNYVSEIPGVVFRCFRQCHVELSCRRPLQIKAAVIHNPPDKPRAIEAFEPSGAPDIGLSEMTVDDGFQAAFIARRFRFWRVRLKRQDLGSRNERQQEGD